MFGYLKNKLKDAVDKFSKEVDQESEVVEESQEPEKPTPEEKTGFFKKFWGKKEEETLEEDEKDTTKDATRDITKDTEKDTTSDTTKDTIREEPQEEVREKQSVEAEEPVEPPRQEQLETKEKGEEKQTKKEPAPETKEESLEEEIGEDAEVQKEPVQDESEGLEERGFFGRVRGSVVDAITKSSISEEKFNNLFWDIEMALLENNVAVSVIDKIREDLKEKLVNTKVRRGKTLDIIRDTLNNSINEVLDVQGIDLEEKVKGKKPYIITFVGVNGSGKTTSIAKLAYVLKQKGYHSVIAAADTFRAAAIQQLEEHADKVGVKLIKHDYGADPAAVSFDAIKYANSKRLDFVLIDTAGRLHSNSNLVDEMKKIVRVAKPDMKIFVGESTTGNDCVEQAERFNEAVGIDGIILAKADVDPKGGAAISVSHVTGKPILYIGIGQDYNDLKKFDSKLVVESLGLAS